MNDNVTLEDFLQFNVQLKIDSVLYALAKPVWLSSTTHIANFLFEI